MKIKLSEHFTYQKLILFTLPSIVTIVFMSIYGVVDGFFISNYVGKEAFAAVNLIIPFTFLLATLGFMFGTGGSAIVARELGAGNNLYAKQIFTMLFLVLVSLGIVMTIIGQIVLPDAIMWFGGTNALFPLCLEYGRILITGTVFFMLQNFFQAFFITAGKPNYGLYCTIFAGCGNIVLDYLLVGVLKLGVAGAAYATLVSYVIGGLLPVFYFVSRNHSLLCFRKPVFSFDKLIHTCTNGASELLTNASGNIVNILYNLQLMRLIGEDGVSSYGVVMYVYWIFAAVYIGYSIGCAPLVSYHFGAKDSYEVKNLFRKSVILIGFLSIGLTCLALVSAKSLAKLYVGYDARLFALTTHAFKIFSVSFLVMGINIFASGFFTSLSDGFTSALISLLRTFLFQIISILLLPVFFGVEGIWWSVCFAEGCALIVAVICFVRKRNTYHYA